MEEYGLIKRFLLYFESWPTESLVRLVDHYSKSSLESEKDPKIIELRILINELKTANEKDKIWAIRKAIYKICND